MGPPPSPLTVRRVQFAYPDDLDPVWVPSRPEFSHAANCISLIMPFAEPYFVRSVRAALAELPADAQAGVADYLGQEMAHQGQHKRFNRFVTARYPGVTRVEGWMRRFYGWLGRSRSMKFNLAFAAGSETIAYALARWTEKHLGTLFSGADPVAATLYLWHLAEEVEHKSSAYDVFEAVDGSRLRYAWASTVSLVALAFFVWTGSLAMLKADRRLFSPVAQFRLTRWAVSLGMEILPTLFVSALPRHHPSKFADPVFLPRWLSQFDPETGTMPLWDGAAGRAA